METRNKKSQRTHRGTYTTQANVFSKLKHNNFRSNKCQPHFPMVFLDTSANQRNAREIWKPVFYKSTNLGIYSEKVWVNNKRGESMEHQVLLQGWESVCLGVGGNPLLENKKVSKFQSPTFSHFQIFKLSDFKVSKM